MSRTLQNRAMRPPRLHLMPRTLLWRAGHSVLLSLAIAVLLTALGRQGFGINLVYSLCIGSLCWAFIDGGRALLARRLHRRRPELPEAALGWPGWGPMALCIALGVPAAYALGFTLADWLTGAAQPARWLGMRGYAGLLLLSLAAAVAVTGFFYLKERMAAAEAEMQAVRRVAAETQLRLLEAQLEPHMLFNTLANLRALIALDPPRAQAMLDRLIAFLRATLGASRCELHPLEREFERLADYLALMQVRMGARLQTALELPRELAAQPVPPLLLQPLVENAIRHGLEPRHAGGRITVSAARRGERLLLQVHDSGAGLVGPPRGDGAQPGGGFGIRQVQERLATVYGREARFALAPAAGGGTLATIELPLHAPAP